MLYVCIMTTEEFKILSSSSWDSFQRQADKGKAEYLLAWDLFNMIELEKKVHDINSLIQKLGWKI